mmetsp:Transcript_5554/g.13918  ORF Transcript_5554/g.13918 Transcript_5554/m.13918 type:complete len:414 (+) Transcript_5554:98-1339(+)
MNSNLANRNQPGKTMDSRDLSSTEKTFGTYSNCHPDSRNVELDELESAESDRKGECVGLHSACSTSIDDVESVEIHFGQNEDCIDDDTQRPATTKVLAEAERVDSFASNIDNDITDNDLLETDSEAEMNENLVSHRYVKIVIGLIFLTIVLFVTIDGFFGKNYVRQAITVFLDWIRENPGAGVVAFIAVFFICTLICVPGALMTFGAGFVFSASNEGNVVVGTAFGTLAVFVGASASSVVAFLLARYLLYDRVRRLSQKYSVFEALDVALSKKGFRIMCLLRLSPITPFVLLNYIAGVTTVTLSSYAMSIFCILPGTVLFVFLGASAGSLTDKSESKTATAIAVTAGVVFGVIAIGLTSYYAKQELNKEVDLVRSQLYNRTTSRRNRLKHKRKSERRQRSRYRRKIDRIRARI